MSKRIHSQDPEDAALVRNFDRFFVMRVWQTIGMDERREIWGQSPTEADYLSAIKNDPRMTDRPLKPGPVDCFVTVGKEKVDELAIRYGFEPDLNIHLFANALMCAFEFHNGMRARLTDEESHE